MIARNLEEPTDLFFVYVKLVEAGKYRGGSDMAKKWCNILKRSLNMKGLIRHGLADRYCVSGKPHGFVGLEPPGDVIVTESFAQVRR